MIKSINEPNSQPAGDAWGEVYLPEFLSQGDTLKMDDQSGGGKILSLTSASIRIVFLYGPISPKHKQLLKQI